MQDRSIDSCRLRLGMFALTVMVFLELSCMAPIGGDDETAFQNKVWTGDRVTVKVRVSSDLSGRSFSEDQLKVLVDYYEVFFRETGEIICVASDAKEKGNGDLSVELIAGKTYDMLLLAGFKKNRILMASAYTPAYTIEANKSNNISLSLKPIVINLDNDIRFSGVSVSDSLPLEILKDSTGSLVTTITIGNIEPLTKAINDGNDGNTLFNRNVLSFEPIGIENFFTSFTALADIDIDKIKFAYNADTASPATRTQTGLIGTLSNTATLEANKGLKELLGTASAGLLSALNGLNNSIVTDNNGPKANTKAAIELAITAIGSAENGAISAINNTLNIDLITANDIIGTVPEVLKGSRAVKQAVDGVLRLTKTAMDLAVIANVNGTSAYNNAEAAFSNVKTALSDFQEALITFGNTQNGDIMESEEGITTISSVYTIPDTYIPHKDVTGKIYFGLEYYPFSLSTGRRWFIRNGLNYEIDRNDGSSIGGAILAKIGDGSPISSGEAVVISPSW